VPKRPSGASKHRQECRCHKRLVISASTSQLGVGSERESTRLFVIWVPIRPPSSCSNSEKTLSHFMPESVLCRTNPGLARFIQLEKVGVPSRLDDRRSTIGERSPGSRSSGFMTLSIPYARWRSYRARLRSLRLHSVTEERKAAQEAHDTDARIVQACEDERRKIGRELHDSTAQKIFAVNLNLAGLKTLVPAGDKRAQELLSETIALGEECLQELRSISYLLRPPLPEGHEFRAALCSYIDGFCKRSPIHINLVIPSHASRMPPRVENVLFRVVQEALSNIQKHSQSASATVTLRKDAGSVVLEVRDRGKGLPRSAGPGPFWCGGGGLAGIAERLREIGGSLEIRRANPGTIVVAMVPLQEPHRRPEVAA